MQIDKMTAQELRQREVEGIINKPAFNFEDLEKLDYSEINSISNKYGEAGFNPKELLDFDEDGSEGSEGDEILRRYRNKTKVSEHRTQNDLTGVSDASPGHFNNRKFSKPSNYSYQDSQNSHMIMNKLYDRTLASQDLNQMNNLGVAASENPAAKIGQIGSQQPYVSPMYSPLQHHNPKRKMNDLGGKKMIKGDHHLQSQHNGDLNNMQMMQVPQPQHRHNNSLVNKGQFRSQRELPNRNYQDSQSYK